MAVLPISITGDPVLHSPAKPVDSIDGAIRELVANMFDTMDAAPGVGLAAPQIGVPLRIFTYSWNDDEVSWRGVAINPELLITPPPVGVPNPKEESEGCLSVPGERFGLRRAERAILHATDLENVAYEINATGWLARIFQHEFDHLCGILYTDRLGEEEQRVVKKVTRKLGWGVPGQQWVPGVDRLEG